MTSKYPMSVGWLETTEAALNAVLGDYLERRGNGLAIEMAFYHQGAPLPLSEAALRAAHPRLGSRIVICIHGMAETEGCWSFPSEPGRSYGTLLRDELGRTPFYLRYNSGRSIAQNGKELAERLEQLVDAFPVSVDEITLIGHSMGGLLIRSACYYAEQRGLTWIRRARRAFYLGAPHLGSPFEKAGHLASVVLGAIDNPVVRLTHTIANLRSAGVKDMRHGSLLDDEVPASAAGSRSASPAPPLPLFAGMDHRFIAGTLTQQENHLVAKLFGDGLVRLPSAVEPGLRARLSPDHFAILPGIHHLELAHSPEVYAKIRDAFGATAIEEAPGPVTASDVEDHSTPSATPTDRGLERAGAYLALLQDAVDHGATAVQQVQEELTARPYDLIALVPPLEAPANIVRTAHFAAVRHAYGMTRLVNRLVGTVLHEGLERLRRA